MASDNGMHDLVNNSSIWTVAMAAIAGFIGLRVGAAKDSVRLQIHTDQLTKLETQMEKVIERDSKSDKETAIAISSINTTLTTLVSAVNRIDARLLEMEREHRGFLGGGQ